MQRWSRSEGTLALAAGHGTALLAPLHPTHHMGEMSPVEAVGTPHDGVAQTLPTVFNLDQCAILLEFLRIAVVDGHWKETHHALGQHVHTVQTTHDLITHIL